MAIMCGLMGIMMIWVDDFDNDLTTKREITKHTKPLVDIIKSLCPLC